MRVLGLALWMAAFAGPAMAIELRPAEVTPVAWQFNLVNSGEVDGEWRYTMERDGTRMHIFGGTAWVSENINETEDMYVDAGTWSPESLTVHGDFAGTLLNADLAWDGAHLTGPITIQQAGAEPNQQSFDIQMEQPVLERTAFFGALRGAALESGDETTISWFNVHVNGVESATISVGALQEIQVPAGSFEVYPVEITGPVLTNIVYVTSTVPRDIVRVDVVGQPMVFELVSSTTP